MKKQPSQEEAFQQSGYQQKPKSESESNYVIQQQRQQHNLQQQLRGQYQRPNVPQNYNQIYQSMSAQQRGPNPSYSSTDQSQMMQQQQQAAMMQQHQQQQMQQTHQSNQLIGPLDIKGLTQKISNKEVLDQHVEKTLALLAEDFVKNVAEFSCKLAKHRGSDTLEKEDIKFAIEKLYNIPTPIKPNSDRQPNTSSTVQPPVGQATTQNYRHNIILVKKANEQNPPNQ